MDSEVWKQIEDFPNYYISDGGRVINLAKRRILTPHAMGSARLYVRLYKNGMAHTTTIGHLLEEYHG